MKAMKALKGTIPMSMASLRAAGKPWYSYWEGKSIIFQRVFGTGGGNLRDKASKPGRFRLESRFSPAGALIQFAINFDDDSVHPILKGQLLTPRGSREFPFSGNPFSEWKADAAHEEEYSAGLDRLVSYLHDDDCPFQRLEATVPFPVGNEILVDRMRILLLPDAVKLKNGDLKDLAVVVFTLTETTELAAMQNGGGNGPPEP